MLTISALFLRVFFLVVSCVFICAHGLGELHAKERVESGVERAVSVWARCVFMQVFARVYGRFASASVGVACARVCVCGCVCVCVVVCVCVCVVMLDGGVGMPWLKR